MPGVVQIAAPSLHAGSAASRPRSSQAAVQRPGSRPGSASAEQASTLFMTPSPIIGARHGRKVQSARTVSEVGSPAPQSGWRLVPCLRSCEGPLVLLSATVQTKSRGASAGPLGADFFQ